MAKNNNLGDFLTDIANAIRTKKGTSGLIPAQEFSDEILSIPSGGGGVVDEYFYYAKSYYTITNNATLFANAWQDSQDSETVLYDIPLELAEANNEDLEADLYVGTNDQLEKLYNDCVNGVATIPFESVDGIYIFGDVEVFDESMFFILDSVAVLGKDLGIVLGKFAGFSIPNNNIVIKQGFKFENENGIIIPESVTSIGSGAFRDWQTNDQPLVMPNSVTSIGGSAFYGWTSNNQPLVIPNTVTSIGSEAFRAWSSNKQPLVIPESVTSIGDYAFAYWNSNTHPLVIPESVTSIGNYAFSYWRANNQPLVIPESATSIGDYAFRNWSSNNQPLVIPSSVTSIGQSVFSDWSSNNQPLVIPNSVTTIGYYAFAYWNSNNQPLVIPNTVTSIGYSAFSGWYANNRPLVIPDSVTSIGSSAFYNWALVPYVEIKAVIPPTLAHANAFGNQNNAPIYVPDESLDDYKAATNWVTLADRIFPVSEKP